VAEVVVHDAYGLGTDSSEEMITMTLATGAIGGTSAASIYGTGITVFGLACFAFCGGDVPLGVFWAFFPALVVVIHGETFGTLVANVSEETWFATVAELWHVAAGASDGTGLAFVSGQIVVLQTLSGAVVFDAFS